MFVEREIDAQLLLCELARGVHCILFGVEHDDCCDPLVYL